MALDLSTFQPVNNPTGTPTNTGTSAGGSLNLANFKPVSQGLQQPAQPQANPSLGANGNMFSSKPIYQGGIGGLAAPANFLTGSVQKFGSDLSQGFYLMFGGQNKIDNITKGYLDDAARNTAFAAKTTDPTQKALYQKLATNDFTSATRVGNSIIGDTRTPEQIIGDAVGTATDILGAGTLEAPEAEGAYQTATKIAPTALERIAQGAEVGGKIGLVQGAGQSAAASMGTNQSASDVAKNTLKGGAIGAGTGIVTGGATSYGIGKIGSLINPVPEDESALLQDTISPKQTSAETKLAMKESRIVSGKEPTMFLSGTPDTVLTSQETQDAAKTIQKYIPNENNIYSKEPELYNAVKGKIGDIAKELTPQMEKTPITEEVLDKFNDDWSTTKETQIKNAERTEEPNVAKRQEAFETNVLKTISESKNPTMNDLWEARQNYDDSVPARVKNATENSDIKLQNQKEEWLQNRRVLSNAINDSKTGLGKTSQQAFSDMSDLYDANENMLTKAKVNSDAQPSKIIQFAKNHPYITGGAAAAAASATGLPQRGIKALTGL